MTDCRIATSPDLAVDARRDLSLDHAPLRRESPRGSVELDLGLMRRDRNQPDNAARFRFEDVVLVRT